jgi:hypothetical protein
VGALETKKLLLLSGWTMERCEFSFAKDNRSDTQVEDALSWLAPPGARNKFAQTAMRCKEAWQTDEVMGDPQKKTFQLPVGTQRRMGGGTSAPGAKTPDDGRQNPVAERGPLLSGKEIGAFGVWLLSLLSYVPLRHELCLCFLLP